MKRALLLLFAACGSFQDPDIVVDFRVLAMRASVPEQIVDFDITNPPTPAQVLDQLVDTEVCVLLSDRNFERRLRWSLTLCNLDGDDRCPDSPKTELGSGLWDDPDLALPDPPALCARVPADGNLIGILYDALQNDQFHGLGGIYYGVALRVGGEDADPDLDLYAAKNLRVQPRIPPDLTANTNPFLNELDIRLEEDGEMMPIPIIASRCIDYSARGESPIVVAPEQKVRFTPVETEGVREVYVVPTTDGGERMFTESLTYQWLATAGKYSSSTTGGTRDRFGNPPPLFTDWTAPAAEDLDGPLDVDVWTLQRDERLGAAWYQTCLRVMP